MIQLVARMKFLRFALVLDPLMSALVECRSISFQVYLVIAYCTSA